MNRQQYDFLTKFKSNMIAAVESGYSRNIRNPDRKRIREIYIEVSGETLTGNIYCMKCLVDMLKKVKPYYDAGVIQEAKTPQSTAKARKTKEKHGSEEAEKKTGGKREKPAASSQEENIKGGGEISASPAGGRLDS